MNNERNDVMSDYIKRTLVKAQFTGTFNDEYPVSLCKTLIDEVPSADVQEVKHGKWEQVDDTKCRCSSCKKVFLIAVYTNGGDKNYCPNCGARMDLEE